MVRTLGFHPKNVGSNPASLIQLFFNRSIKIRKRAPLKSGKSSRFFTQNILKFGSLFSPSAFKDISLFFRNNLKYNSLLSGKPQKRILVKQSYIFLIWIRYLMDRGVSTPAEGNSLVGKVTYPSFFVHPFRNYKTTITRAPMAHKTYSQEQFMVRFYKFSISFYTKISDRTCVIDSLNKSAFLIHFLKSQKPYISTNMLFLHKYTIIFYSRDIKYFTFAARINTKYK